MLRAVAWHVRLIQGLASPDSAIRVTLASKWLASETLVPAETSNPCLANRFVLRLANEPPRP
eukprot:15465346-Alexandrium_andersonii.AAC.1